MIHVVLPTQLDSYTGGQRELHLDSGGTVPLSRVIDQLEARYRGLAFRIVDEHGRIRRHIAIFVGEELVRTLTVEVPDGGRVQIVGALSGG
jgi:sulfur-carrier protein